MLQTERALIETPEIAAWSITRNTSRDLSTTNSRSRNRTVLRQCHVLPAPARATTNRTGATNSSSANNVPRPSLYTSTSPKPIPAIRTQSVGLPRKPPSPPGSNAHHSSGWNNDSRSSELNICPCFPPDP